MIHWPIVVRVVTLGVLWLPQSLCNKPEIYDHQMQWRTNHMPDPWHVLHTQGTNSCIITCSVSGLDWWKRLSSYFINHSTKWKWVGVWWLKGNTGPHLNIKMVYPGMGIPIIKIRWSWDHLIFIMGIPIPGKMVFYIETPSSASVFNAPCLSVFNVCSSHWDLKLGTSIQMKFISLIVCFIAT